MISELNSTSLLFLDSDFCVLLTTLTVANGSKLKRAEKSQNTVFHSRSCAWSCCVFCFSHILTHALVTVLSSINVHPLRRRSQSGWAVWRHCASRLRAPRILCFVCFCRVTSSLFVQRAEELEHVRVVETTWEKNVRNHNLIQNLWNDNVNLPVIFKKKSKYIFKWLKALNDNSLNQIILPGNNHVWSLKENS